MYVKCSKICRNSIAPEKLRKLSVAFKRSTQHNASNLLASFSVVVAEEVQHNSTLSNIIVYH